MYKIKWNSKQVDERESYHADFFLYTSEETLGIQTLGHFVIYQVLNIFIACFFLIFTFIEHFLPFLWTSLYNTHWKKILTTNLTINSLWKYYYQYIDNKIDILLQISTKMFSYNNNRDQNSNQNKRWDYWFHFSSIFLLGVQKNFTQRVC